MRKATRKVAALFGVIAGVSGLEHGIFEILQGNTRPLSLMFPSMGSPCIPEKVWNACEPATTILPNFMLAGILTVIISLSIMIWSAAFVQSKNGGSVLILLSIILLLVGGGFFPPLIGLVADTAGTQINKSLAGKSTGSILRIAAKVWPWPLVIFMVWILGQFLVGYFFNDFLMSVMGFSLLLILAMLPLSIYTGYAFDVNKSLLDVQGVSPLVE
jgi:hypothetical protein